MKKQEFKDNELVTVEDEAAVEDDLADDYTDDAEDELILDDSACGEDEE